MSQVSAPPVTAPRSRRVGPRARMWEAAGWAAAMAVVYLTWIGDNTFHQDLAVLACAYALIGLGMYIPLILNGALSIAYNVYFVLGAYSVALVSHRSAWPLWLGIPIALIVSGLIAAIVGLVTRGLSSYALAVATLTVAQAADRSIIDLGSVTGGSNGLSGLRSLNLFGFSLSRTAVVIGGLAAVWVVAVLVNRFRDSHLGIALRMFREAPVAAEACGVPTETIRVIGLSLGAALASVAGVLLALVNRAVIPESFTFGSVFVIIFAPIIGGTRTAWGAVLGAALLIGISQLGFGSAVAGSLIFGVAVLVVLLVAPGGILGLPRDVLNWLPKRRGERL